MSSLPQVTREPYRPEEGPGFAGPHEVLSLCTRSSVTVLQGPPWCSPPRTQRRRRRRTRGRPAPGLPPTPTSTPSPELTQVRLRFGPPDADRCRALCTRTDDTAVHTALRGPTVKALLLEVLQLRDGRGLKRYPAFAGSWRKRYAVPIGRHATATMCNNASVLQTGRSLAALVHPLLPLCILGYGRKAASTV